MTYNKALHRGCKNARRCINGTWCERTREYVEHRPRCDHYESKWAEGINPTAK